MSIENNNLIAKMDEVLKYEVAQRHSYFQLKYFIIGKEPTIQSKMWQCLRELKSRRESLESIELELENSKDTMELLDISIEKINYNLAKIDKTNLTENDPINLTIQENEIKIRQIKRQKKAANTNSLQLTERKKYLEEESRFFLDTFTNLLKIEPLKHFDDIESQKQYWSERLAQKLNLKMLTHNQLDTELVETIVALPDDMPIKRQALGTLELRHTNMVQQLKSTMQHIGTIEDNK